MRVGAGCYLFSGGHFKRLRGYMSIPRKSLPSLVELSLLRDMLSDDQAFLRQVIPGDGVVTGSVESWDFIAQVESEHLERRVPLLDAGLAQLVAEWAGGRRGWWWDTASGGVYLVSGDCRIPLQGE